MTASTSQKMLWAGRVVSAIPILMLLMSAGMKITAQPAVIDSLPKLGYNPNIALGLGLVELACTIAYAVPRTTYLGAILLTGYLGGATATHVRLDEPYVTPIVLGIVIWGGLFLRDERLRRMIPLNYKA